MAKRTDIKKVLIIGSGPIVIGQAAEFDYAGTQACRALKEEGLEVILINSNPATIMTDKAMADKTNGVIEKCDAFIVDQLKKDIAEMEEILGDKKKVRNIIVKELKDVIKNYGQPRKTEIIYDSLLVEPEEEEDDTASTPSGIPDRPYAKGRAYDPDRFKADDTEE